ncbi:PspC domain-containing protein [Daejeonella sp. JGW-45]|uniref:PspC domain-containing protein n=1 Tax=Daejeonella sp. JGW-45 TaxID=3034148 RepID=UPI0023EB3AA8|nr:PspC domain-containing protein [Daejeonella sp. JGW-45]
MNKTIIININGIVFHIEEDAYEVLRAYMTDVKRHFAYSADSEEIVTDIENRLAEMFNERLEVDHKQVIELPDVTFVTGKMGNVNDFDLDEEDGTSLRSVRKLFRDTDDRILGGVCSGIGHFFNVEPRWMRLLAIALIFIGGLGLPVYVILWIIMPAANTRAEKMAMKGEPINLQNFKKNFDEEIEGLKGGLNRAHNEVRPVVYQIGKFIETLATLFIKLVVSIVAFAGILAMIALFIGLVVFLGYWNSNELNTFPFTIVNPGYKSVLALSAFIIVVIPLTALVLFALRVLVTRITISKTVYFSMLIIWIAGLVLGAYHASKIASEFNEEAEFSVTTPLTPLPVYHLKVNRVEFLTKEDSLQYNINPANFKGTLISRDRDSNNPRSVRIVIVRGEVNKPTLVQEFSARGPNFETALATARRTKHEFVQKDSVLMFHSKTHLQKRELWRDQSVRLILRIPENTRLMIDDDVNSYLSDHDVWECHPPNAPRDYISEWRMTSEGLKCQNDTLFPQQQDSIQLNP